ncbi:hypothetical protein D3C78_1488210 [compost metagenome]
MGGELQRFALRHDPFQARMPGQHEAAPERLVGQAHRRLRTQTLAVQAQQHHRAAGEYLAQADHQALQAHGRWQLPDQVGEQGVLQWGEIYHFGYP